MVDDDNLVSQVAVILYGHYLWQDLRHGRSDRSRNLSEYSNMGLMHKLLEQALRNMKGEDRTSVICIHIPFHITAAGMEIISTKSLRDQRLSASKGHLGPG